MRRIAIFVSGAGTNLRAIAKYKGDYDIACVFSDNPGCYALDIANDFNLKVYTFNLRSCKTKELFEKKIINIMDKEKIDLICLAGYMKIIGPTLLNKYKNKIINIHPSLLPKYKGKNAIMDALRNDEKTTGVTIHYVNHDLDGGKIIAQEIVEILDNDDFDSLRSRIHNKEHEMYPKIIEGVLK